MNKLTKLSCSALCGSLAAVSAANAGDMTVTGGVDMSWISLQGDVTGNPIGIGSNLTFKGSGELDNGWTFDVTVANLNADVYSSTVVDLVMGGLGKLNFNQGNSGNGIDAYDDKMPTAWEEPWGMGLQLGLS
jgi:outer membrane protein OmpU